MRGAVVAFLPHRARDWVFNKTGAGQVRERDGKKAIPAGEEKSHQRPGYARRDSNGGPIMSTSRLMLAATFAAALSCGGAASAQTIMAQEKKPAAAPAAAAAKPAAPAEKKTAAISPDKQQHSRGGRIPVYLLRGLLNIFSLGMDDLGEKIKRRGYPVVVTNYSDWQSIADDIAQKYKSGWSGPIVLIGHSYGADAVMLMGEYLGKKGVPVNLIVPFDGTGSYAATPNVQRVFNIYQREYAKQTRGPGFHGELTNYYVNDPEIGHTSIDKAAKLHNLVLSRLGGGGTAKPKPADAPATPGASNTPPAAPATPAAGSASAAKPHG
jgi:hypothetical protein